MSRPLPVTCELYLQRCLIHPLYRVASVVVAITLYTASHFIMFFHYLWYYKKTMNNCLLWILRMCLLHASWSCMNPKILSRAFSSMLFEQFVSKPGNGHCFTSTLRYKAHIANSSDTINSFTIFVLFSYFACS